MAVISLPVASFTRNPVKRALSFLDKMAVFNQEAVITQVIPDGIKPKFISLTDDAIGMVVTFASAAIFALQDDAFFKALNTGLSPDEAKAFELASIEMQEIALQLMKARSANMDGTAVVGPNLTATFLTGKTAKAAGYPVKDTTADDDPYLYLTIPPGAKGDNGIQGIQGIVGPAGPAGPAGSDAVCGTCTGPDGGGTGPGGGGGGGSGPGGSPNPDGKDTVVYLQNCNTPIINQPFCSNSFTYANYDIRPLIVAAASASGHFNSSTEDIISAVVDWNGAGYAGVVTLNVQNPVVNFTTSNNFGPLQISDAEDEQLVLPHTVVDFGITGVLVVRGYNYHGSTALMLQPDTVPIDLNGTVSQYPILGSANCHNPPDATDPAWLKGCLLSFVKHPKAVVCPALDPNVTYFKVGTSEGYPAISNRTYWDFGGFDANQGLVFNNQYGYKARNNVYGFETGKTYGCTVNGQAYNGGNMSWGLFYTDNTNNAIVRSTTHVEPRHNNYGLYDFVLPTITVPAGSGVAYCSTIYLMIFIPEATGTVSIYEV